MRGAYDFEASEWVKPMCNGLLWGPRDRRQWVFIPREKKNDFQSVARQTLKTMWALHESKAGPSEWWGHNAGKYDISFIVEAIIALGWEATGHVAGGRTVYLAARPKGAKSVIAFLDSMAVVQSGLARAGIDFSLPSSKLLGKEDYKIDASLWSKERLEKGCRADCEVVLDLLDCVETHLENWGGELRTTFSASALSVLAAKTEIPDMKPHRALNRLARQAYFGGRVEVFRHSPKEVLCEVDVTSSYPWAMTQPLPVRVAEGLSDEPKVISRVLAGEDREGIVYASVSVPVDTELPVLPYRPETGGVFFPVGQWQGWFQACELRYAKTQGVSSRVHACASFTKETIFEGFVKEVFELKQKAKGAARSFAKLVLNGCYGKFAQGPEREDIRLFSTTDEGVRFMLEKPPDTVRPLNPRDERFMAYSFERWPKQTHFALAGAVTAQSRVLLHRYLLQSKRPAYCDTDSVHAARSSLKPLKNFLGEELGQLKVEVEEMHGSFYAPKLYALKALTKKKPLAWDEDKKPVMELFASKGFKVDKETFQKVVNGEEVTREVMRLLKRQLRANGFAGRDVQVREWLGHSSKRRPLPSGETAPWNVRELDAAEHLKAKSPLAPDK